MDTKPVNDRTKVELCTFILFWFKQRLTLAAVLKRCLKAMLKYCYCIKLSMYTNSNSLSIRSVAQQCLRVLPPQQSCPGNIRQSCPNIRRCRERATPSATLLKFHPGGTQRPSQYIPAELDRCMGRRSLWQCFSTFHGMRNTKILSDSSRNTAIIKEHAQNTTIMKEHANVCDNCS